MAVGAAKSGLPLTFFQYKSTSSPPWNPRKPPKHLPKPNYRRPCYHSISSSLVEEEEEREQRLSFTQPEALLIDGLLGIQGRGRSATPQQLKGVEQAVKALEDLKGVPDPTSSSLIEGCWQLVFTTRPGTASPIQRTFVGVDSFKVFQEVYLRTDDPRVSNLVRFSDSVGELKVEAAAKVEDGKRILFQFDRAAFSFKFLPFKVPYPVPFRLLGDEAKGWLDTTYLSHDGNMRISRGNKGTTFVLQKETEPRQRLLSAISTDGGVEEIIDELISQKQKGLNGQPDNLEGEWQLLWTSQFEEENWSNAAAAGLKGLQIIKNNGELKNIVGLFPGFRFHAYGRLLKSDSNKYDVMMSNGAIMVGTFTFPMDLRRNFNMEILYIDSKIRIIRAYKQITYVHFRVG